jgi:hypothetical protein
MKKKIFVILIICCVLVPALFVGVYQLGVSNGFKIGEDYAYSQMDAPKGPSSFRMGDIDLPSQNQTSP